MKTYKSNKLALGEPIRDLNQNEAPSKFTLIPKDQSKENSRNNNFLESSKSIFYRRINSSSTEKVRKKERKKDNYQSGSLSQKTMKKKVSRIFIGQNELESATTSKNKFINEKSNNPKINCKTMYQLGSDRKMKIIKNRNNKMPTQSFRYINRLKGVESRCASRRRISFKGKNQFRTVENDHSLDRKVGLINRTNNYFLESNGGGEVL